jgi:hypothetical protein
MKPSTGVTATSSAKSDSLCVEVSAVQIDVDDRHVRLELPDPCQGLGRRGGHTGDGEPLTHEELRGSFEEAPGVIHQ